MRQFFALASMACAVAIPASFVMEKQMLGALAILGLPCCLLAFGMCRLFGKEK